MADKSVAPVYALVGPDPFMQLQFIGDIVARAGAGTRRIDVDGERAGLADVLDEVRSFALFGTGKVVVVQSADAFITRHREAMEEYVAKPSDSATLVLRLNSLPATQRIYKAIAKTGVIENCTPPKDLARWIINRGQAAHDVKIGPEAARLLADYIGDDLARLDSELAKLALTVSTEAGESGEVKPQDIMAGVAFQREQELSEMVNAVAAGRVAEAIRRWRRLLQTDSSAEFRAVTWLTMWLGNVRKAWALKKAGSPVGSIAQTLRIWPRESQGPFLETAWAIGEPGVARALDGLTEIDRQSKSGVGSAAENVERFLVDLGGILGQRKSK